MAHINGGTKLLGMIGHPVAQTKSPQINSTFALKMGLPYVMVATDVTADTLEKWIEAAKIMGIVGFSVTMPLKEIIIPYCDSVAPGCQAVNCVAIRDGKLHGRCTDGAGFVHSLELCGFDFKGVALVLGAGGAAKGIVPELLGKGMMVKVCARRPGTFPDMTGVDKFEWALLSELTAGVSLLANCTSIGMAGVGSEFSDFGFLDNLPANAVVYDIIHSPRVTKLLAEAQKRGHKTLNGIPMCVGQAAVAFEYWTGQAVSAEVFAEVSEMMEQA